MEPFELRLAALSIEQGDYLIAQLPLHLVQAEDWDKLDFLLSEFGFMKAKTDRAGIYRLIADYTAALARYPERKPEQKQFQAIAQLLEREAPTVLEHSNLLFQQLYNEASFREGLSPYFKARMEAVRSRQMEPWLHMWPCSPPLPEPIRLLETAGHKLRRMVASPSERWIAGASSNGVMTWAVDSGERLWLRDSTATPWLLGFSADERDVLCGIGDQLSSLRLESGSTNGIASTGQHVALASAIESQKFAVLQTDGTLTLRRAKDARVVMGLASLSSGFTACLALARDASLVAAGREEGRVQVWSTESGALVADLRGHGTRNEIPPELANESYWDDPLTEIIGFVGPGKGAVRLLAFSKDGRMLAVGCDSTIRCRSLGEVRFWDTTTWQEIESVFSAGGICSLAYGCNAELAVAIDEQVRIWAVHGSEPRTVSGRRGVPVELALIRNDAMLAIARPDAIELWDANSSEATTGQKGHAESIRTISLSPDSALAASGSHSSAVLVWDAATGRRVMELQGHRGPVYQVQFSPCGKLLATGGEDGTCIVWELETGRILVKANARSGSIGSCAFSPNGRWLSAAGQDEHLLIDLTESRPSARIEHKRFYGISQAFSPSGRQLAVASASELALWELDPTDKEPFRKITDLAQPASFWGGVAFSPDGETIAYADIRKVFVVNATTRNARALGQHTGEVLALAFSPDGNLIASGAQGSEDANSRGDIRIWRVASGEVCAYLPCRDRVMAIRFLAPQHLCFADAGGAARAPRIWRAELVEPPGP